MKKIIKIIDNIEEIILLPSFMFSVALIFVQVVFRYVFKNSLTWSEELARYIFIWQLWIGVSYAAKNGTHIRVTILKDALSAKQKKILETLVLMTWFGFGCFVIYQGYEIAMKIGAYGQKSPAMQLPMVYAYMAIPVGASMMNLRLIQNLIKLYRSQEMEVLS